MTTLSKAELIEEANKDATVSAFRVSVIYGDFGKRKTTTACSMVNERGLLLSSDDSWKVLLNPRHEELAKKITVVKLEGLSQLEHVNFDGFDTIIWDTFSKSVDRYLDLIYDKGKWISDKTGKVMYREMLDTQDKELKDVSILAPMDYRVTRDIFRPVLDRLFNETGAHIIFTSQMKEPIPGLSKTTENRPDVPAATFKIVAERADLIANIRPASRGKFIIDLTEGSLVYLAKSRIEELQGQMDSDVFVSKYKEIVFK